MKRSLAILGSTGSIGTQALEVVSEHADLFEVYALTANNQVDLLINQARKYMPEVVVIANEQKYPELKEALEDLPIKVWAGSDAIAQVVQSEPIDMVLTAMVGYSGLKPTIAAIKAGKAIALANKETLVVAGELITSLAAEYKVPVLPVDSEHSAIFQCLAGEWENQVEKILLTASGGPFRTKTMEELAVVTKAQALKHPNWTMGAKVTIDSASMMNKGFEMIEAKCDSRTDTGCGASAVCYPFDGTIRGWRCHGTAGHPGYEVAYQLRFFLSEAVDEQSAPPGFQPIFHPDLRRARYDTFPQSCFCIRCNPQRRKYALYPECGERDSGSRFPA